MCESTVLQFEVYSKEYLEKSWGWLNDPEIRLLTDTPVFSKEDQQRWFASLAERDDYIVWGVSVDGLKIGVVGLKNITSDQAEYFGYLGEKSYWGKGFGYQMLQFAEIYAREELKVSSLILNVLNINSRAIELYTRYGFTTSERDATHTYMIKGF